MLYARGVTLTLRLMMLRCHIFAIRAAARQRYFLMPSRYCRFAKAYVVYITLRAMRFDVFAAAAMPLYVTLPRCHAGAADAYQRARYDVTILLRC